jgi:guanosine-3',5'-bis(diphosphate) 3'-pyrophosphohydrolase
MAVWSQDSYNHALHFAARAHLGQAMPRQAAETAALPYIVHPVMVAMEVVTALRAEPGRDEDLAVQCALLHDVIEDTPVTYEQLRAEFGGAVADGVQALSKDARLAKAERMADSLARIRRQPVEVWLVKLADRITNLRPPPVDWTPEKIAAYRGEAHEILAALGDGSPFLKARLGSKIEVY